MVSGTAAAAGDDSPSPSSSSSSSSALALSPPPSTSLMYGFKIGDMVWGKVKSHPWWPGHIFNESFASPAVRRSKRPGHVLVAFFGDSSYGWFDLEELIQFEPNFAEKSTQTSSRPFTKAVNEAYDELSRRAALSVTCHCRSLNNFRPTRVANYLSVDVVGYEPGGVYSEEFIGSARKSFKPKRMLEFLNELVVAPRSMEFRNTVSGIKNFAIAMALRKARFEEFDDTYAQAFGVEPARPSKEEMMMEQPVRDPLSGPLRIAEALGDNKKKKLSKQATKHSSPKKDKYLLKRRNEPRTTTLPLPDVRHDVKQSQSSKATVEYNSSEPDSPTLQKTPSPQTTPQRTPEPMQEDEMPPGYEFIGEIDKQLDVSAPPGYTPNTTISTGCSSNHDSKDGSQNSLDSSQPKLEIPVIEGGARKDIASKGKIVRDVVKGKAHKKQHYDVSKGDVKKNKKKNKEHGYITDLTVEDTGDDKKKKKKREREIITDLTNEDTGYVKKKKPKKRRLDSITDLTETPDDGGEKVKPKPEAGASDSPRNLDFEFPDEELAQVLSDLSGVALDPFYGSERNAPDVVRHVFLRFRNKVYSKSLVLPSDTPESDASPSEPTRKQPAEVADISDVNEEREHKPSRPTFRTDDPSRSGRKRPSSDRQEEKFEKKITKMKRLKGLAEEKKALITQKAPEEPAPAPVQVKPVPVSKPPPPPPRVRLPTYLVMKFPPRASLPSVATLKAKFGRFGPLDVSAIRVFWKTFTCKVLYKYKSDAENALSWVQNNDVFGLVNVKYYVKEVEQPAPDPPVEPRVVNGNGVLPFPPRRNPGPLRSIIKRAVPVAGSSVPVPGSKDRKKVRFTSEPPEVHGFPDYGGGSIDVSPPSSLERVVARPRNFRSGSPPLGATDPRPRPPLPPPPQERSVEKPRNTRVGSPPRVATDPRMRPPQHYGSRPSSMPNARPYVPQPPPMVDVRTYVPQPPPMPDVRSYVSQPPPMHGVHTYVSQAPSMLQAPQRSLPTPPPPPPRAERVPDIRLSSEARPLRHPHIKEEGQRREETDISSRMLSLMVRCSSIVANVRAIPGYVPYSPL